MSETIEVPVYAVVIPTIVGFYAIVLLCAVGALFVRLMMRIRHAERATEEVMARLRWAPPIDLEQCGEVHGQMQSATGTACPIPAGSLASQSGAPILAEISQNGAEHDHAFGTHSSRGHAASSTVTNITCSTTSSTWRASSRVHPDLIEMNDTVSGSLGTTTLTTDHEADHKAERCQFIPRARPVDQLLNSTGAGVDTFGGVNVMRPRDRVEIHAHAQSREASSSFPVCCTSDAYEASESANPIPVVSASSGFSCNGNHTPQKLSRYAATTQRRSIRKKSEECGLLQSDEIDEAYYGPGFGVPEVSSINLASSPVMRGSGDDDTSLFTTSSAHMHARAHEPIPIGSINGILYSKANGLGSSLGSRSCSQLQPCSTSHPSGDTDTSIRIRTAAAAVLGIGSQTKSAGDVNGRGSNRSNKNGVAQLHAQATSISNTRYRGDVLSLISNVNANVNTSIELEHAAQGDIDLAIDHDISTTQGTTGMTRAVAGTLRADVALAASAYVNAAVRGSSTSVAGRGHWHHSAVDVPASTLSFPHGVDVSTPGRALAGQGALSSADATAVAGGTGQLQGTACATPRGIRTQHSAQLVHLQPDHEGTASPAPGSGDAIQASAANPPQVPPAASAAGARLAPAVTLTATGPFFVAEAMSMADMNLTIRRPAPQFVDWSRHPVLEIAEELRDHYRVRRVAAGQLQPSTSAAGRPAGLANGASRSDGSLGDGPIIAVNPDDGHALATPAEI